MTARQHSSLVQYESPLLLLCLFISLIREVKNLMCEVQEYMFAKKATLMNQTMLESHKCVPGAVKYPLQ